MKKIVIGAIAVIAIIALAGFGAWYFSNSPKTYAEELEPIMFGTWQVDMIGLIYIGEDQGFFPRTASILLCGIMNQGRRQSRGWKIKKWTYPDQQNIPSSSKH